MDGSVSWLPDGYSQIFRLDVFGPSGFWTMAPLRYAAKFAIWQPWSVFSVEEEEGRFWMPPRAAHKSHRYGGPPSLSYGDHLPLLPPSV